MVKNKEKHYIAENAQLIAEWDWEKNNRLRLYPNKITTGSNVIVWWKCALNHEWQARVANRVDGKTGCPYCSGNKVLHGFNDLLTQNPNLAEEWNTAKNEGLLPSMVSLHSGRKVWWVCDKGHEWQATVANRVNGRNCPYCSGKKILSGYNDLATLYTEIASEWHPTKNSDILPTRVSAKSKKVAFWICPKCKNDYQSEIYHRTSGRGCPYCSSKKIISGFNDLASQNPNLAAEWNMQRNENLLPSMVSLHSEKKVWWVCDKGHEWQATVANRVSGRGCPYCSGKKILAGYNDLATINPDLAREWHPFKNGSLMPTMVSSASHKKVWWKCRNGHEWQAVVGNRNSGTGCPLCAKKSFKK